MGFKSFVEAGIASIVAGCSTHPLDLIRVRMQLQGETNPKMEARNIQLRRIGNGSTNMGAFATGIRIVNQDGVAALFSGVSATILRQALYSTTRIGLYDIFKGKLTDPTTGKMTLRRKIAAGLMAGGIGAAVGNPAEVAKVRMQADGRLPVAHRRNYTSVGNAIARIAKEEGVTTLWRGSSLSVYRAMVATAAQLASYDHFKEMLLANGLMTDSIAAHATASCAAGLVVPLIANPVDVIRTRLMNMNVEGGQAPPYAGAVDCVKKTVRLEGLMALYKGFFPSGYREGPFTVVLFITLEQVKKLLDGI